MNTIFNELEKEDGSKITIPEGFKLTIDETSQSVYRISLVDSDGRSVENQGSKLYDMVEKAISDLDKIKR